MNSASVADIRKHLKTLDREDLTELCFRLIRYKKENKELLSYILFDSENEAEFIREFKVEMDLLFGDMNTSHVYLAKKTIRKILRLINKYVRFSGSKRMEVDLLIHFCNQLKKTGLPMKSSPVLQNIYARQLVKIEQSLSTLHEDIQFDFAGIVEELKQ